MELPDSKKLLVKNKFSVEYHSLYDAQSHPEILSQVTDGEIPDQIKFTTLNIGSPLRDMWSSGDPEILSRRSYHQRIPSGDVERFSPERTFSKSPENYVVSETRRIMNRRSTNTMNQGALEGKFVSSDSFKDALVKLVMVGLENDRLNTVVSKRDRQLQEAENSLSKQTEQFAGLQAEIEESLNLKDVVSKQAKELEENQKLLKEKNRIISQMTTDFKRQKAEMQSLQQSEQKLSRMNNQYPKLESRLKQLQEEKRQFNDSLRKMRDDQQRTSEDALKKIRELQDKLTMVSTENERLLAQLGQELKQNEALRAVNQELKDTSENKIKEFAEANDQLAEELKNYQNLVDDYEAEGDRNQRELNEIKEHVVPELKERITKTQNELKGIVDDQKALQNQYAPKFGGQYKALPDFKSFVNQLAKDKTDYDKLSKNQKIVMDAIKSNFGGDYTNLKDYDSCIGKLIDNNKNHLKQKNEEDLLKKQIGDQLMSSYNKNQPGFSSLGGPQQYGNMSRSMAAGSPNYGGYQQSGGNGLSSGGAGSTRPTINIDFNNLPSLKTGVQHLMNQNKDLGKYYDDNHGLLDYLVKEMGGVSGPNSGAQGGIGGGSIGDYSKIPDLKTGVKKLVEDFKNLNKNHNNFKTKINDQLKNSLPFSLNNPNNNLNRSQRNSTIRQDPNSTYQVGGAGGDGWVVPDLKTGIDKLVGQNNDYIKNNNNLMNSIQNRLQNQKRDTQFKPIKDLKSGINLLLEDNNQLQKYKDQDDYIKNKIKSNASNIDPSYQNKKDVKSHFDSLIKDNEELQKLKKRDKELQDKIKGVIGPDNNVAQGLTPFLDSLIKDYMELKKMKDAEKNLKNQISSQFQDIYGSNASSPLKNGGMTASTMAGRGSLGSTNSGGGLGAGVSPFNYNNIPDLKTGVQYLLKENKKLNDFRNNDGLLQDSIKSTLGPDFKQNIPDLKSGVNYLIKDRKDMDNYKTKINDLFRDKYNTQSPSGQYGTSPISAKGANGRVSQYSTGVADYKPFNNLGDGIDHLLKDNKDLQKYRDTAEGVKTRIQDGLGQDYSRLNDLPACAEKMSQDLQKYKKDSDNQDKKFKEIKSNLGNNYSKLPDFNSCLDNLIKNQKNTNTLSDKIRNHYNSDSSKLPDISSCVDKLIQGDKELDEVNKLVDSYKNKLGKEYSHLPNIKSYIDKVSKDFEKLKKDRDSDDATKNEIDDSLRSYFLSALPNGMDGSSNFVVGSGPVTRTSNGNTIGSTAGSSNAKNPNMYKSGMSGVGGVNLNFKNLPDLKSGINQIISQNNDYRNIENKLQDQFKNILGPNAQAKDLPDLRTGVDHLLKDRKEMDQYKTKIEDLLRDRLKNSPYSNMGGSGGVNGQSSLSKVNDPIYNYYKNNNSQQPGSSMPNSQTNNFTNFKIPDLKTGLDLIMKDNHDLSKYKDNEFRLKDLISKKLGDDYQKMPDLSSQINKLLSSNQNFDKYVNNIKNRLGDDYKPLKDLDSCIDQLIKDRKGYDKLQSDQNNLQDQINQSLLESNPVSNLGSPRSLDGSSSQKPTNFKDSVQRMLKDNRDLKQDRDNNNKYLDTVRTKMRNLNPGSQANDGEGIKGLRSDYSKCPDLRSCVDTMLNDYSSLARQFDQKLRDIEDRNSEIERLKKRIAELLETLKERDALIQKLKDQLSESKLMMSQWSIEREQLLEENQRLQSIMDGKTRELDHKTYINGKLLMRLACVYAELSRLHNFKDENQKRFQASQITSVMSNAQETSAATKKKNEEPVYDEDDDDFEEFKLENWENEKTQEQIDIKQWQEDWDDEDNDTEFANELKAELGLN